LSHLSEVEHHFMTEAPSLRILNLERNPLSRNAHAQLADITKFEVNLTPKETEDWEDLTI
jgi:uncharacterized protein YozE (UPF0346 family)